MNHAENHAELDDLTARVGRACAAAGLDLIAPLQVGWYNAAVDAAYRLPDFGNAACLALVIGNTRALWPAFLQALGKDAALAADPHPVDRYTTHVVHEALRGIAHACELRFAYEAPPRRVAMQRLAHVAGLAYQSPSHLSVHRTYGPWIGLRAAVVIDAPGPPGPGPALPSPCDCEGHCLPPLQTALRAGSAGSSWREQWTSWVAVRDACPVGQAHRYDEAQIRYHYTKDRRALAAK